IIDQQVLQSMEKATAVYSQGNDKRITAAYDSQNNVDVSDLSKVGYVTALNKVGAKVGAAKVNASDDYANFLNDTLWEKSRSTINVFSKPINEGGMTTRLIPVDGMQRETRANQGVALGNQAQATEYSSIAIGNYDPQCVGASGGLGCVAARSLAERGIAIGLSSEVNKSEGIAIGVAAKAFAEDAIVLGSFANVTGKDAIAIGRSAEVSNTNSIAMGLYANAAGSNSLALGSSAKAETTNTIALGSNAKVSGQDSVAVGRNANAAGDAALALGFEANAKETSAIALGLKAEASGPYSISIGAKGKASDWYSVGLGYGVEVAGERSIALGYQSKVSFKDGVAIGSQVEAKAVGAIVLGSQAKAKEVATIALGSKVEASDPYDIIIGSKGKVSGWQSIGLGYGVEVAGERSIALGYQSKASVDNGVAIGSFSISDRAAGVAGYTSLLQGSATDTKAQWKSTRGAVSIGDPSNNITRQITGVAAGSGDADAVNVAQLKGLEEVVRKNGWKLSVDGENAKTVVMDSDIDFSAGSKNFAITKGDKDNNVKFDLAKDLTLKSIKLGEESVSDDRADAVSSVTLDTTGLIIKNGPKVTTSGIDAGSQKITGVAKGTADTDAVNFSQLKEVQGTAVIKGLKIDTTGKDFVDAIADGENSVAIGANTNAAGSNSLALGFHAEAKASSTIVLGSEAEASDSFSVIIGNRGKVSGGYSVGLGYGAEVSKIFGIALGHDANVAGEDGIALGHDAKVKEMRGIALGYGAEVTKINGIALGTYANVSGEYSLALGYVSKVLVDNGVAIGSTSISDRAAGVAGYTSLLQGPAENSGIEWKSTKGAVSVGDPSRKITRQITNVAAGSEDADAVNVAQLKGLEEVVRKNGWKLSVDGKNAKTVVMDSDIDFSAGSQNFAITKSNDDNKVKFDLAKDLTLKSIKLGEESVSDDRADAVSSVTLDTTGLIIKNGPKVTTSGIDAGSKKITGVKEGSDNTDAVNFGQLQKVEKDVKEQVAASSFVKQDDKTKHITIGKETDGDKIDITNKKNEQRTLTGLKSASLSEASNEAVTGSQLFTTNKNVTTLSDNFKIAATNMAKYFGGDTKYEDGKWTDPTFTIKTVKNDGEEETTTYHNVAAALAGVGNSITNVKNDIKNEITSVKGDSLVKWDDKTKHINIGGEKEDATINIADKESNNRILSGVKKAEKGNEAVNKEQLDENVKKLSGEIADVRSVAVFYDEEVEPKGINPFIRSAPKSNKSNVTFGDPSKGTVGLHNVGDGLIGKESHDVINGSQLHSLGDKVASYLGGKAKYENGKWTDPSFTVKTFDTNGGSADKAYKDVASALTGVGTSIMNVQNKVTEQVNNIMTNVKDDALLWSDSYNAFVAKHGKEIDVGGEPIDKVRGKITFLLDGDVSEGSTDAITGGQLFETNSKVASYLGGGASYQDKTWTDPTFKVKAVNGEGKEEEKTYKNVGEALSGVGNSITNVKNDITKQIKNEISNVKGDSLVKKDAATNVINIGKEVEGSEINVANKSGGSRTLSGVKEATKDNEAVNKGQLDKDLKKLSESLQSEDSAVVHYDKDDKNGSINYTSVTLGGKEKKPVALHNLSDGKIAKDSHDAINGSQLHTLGSTVASYFGGDTRYENGQWSTPNFKLKQFSEDGKSEDKTYQNVSDALSGVSSSLTNVKNTITNEMKKTKGDALLWGKEEGAFVAQHGEKEENSKITSLRDGVISSVSTDAVTGKQLYSVGHALSTYLGGDTRYENGEWTAPSFKITTVKEDGSSEDKTYENVTAAFAGVGTSFTNVQSKITNDINTAITNVKGDSLVKWDEKTKRINIGGEKEDATISIADKDSKDRILSGVKDAEHSNEAVNKGQLDKEIADVRSVAVFYDEEEAADEPHLFTRSLRKVNKSSVTFGDPKTGPVGLHNVGNGKVTEDSHDAINGSQLFETNSKVASYLGGGTGYKDEAWTSPTFKVKTVKDDGKEEEQTYHNVSDALTGVGSSIANVQNKVTEQVNNAITTFKGDALLWGATDNAFSAQHEKDGAKTNSKITHILDGNISKDSTDAITGNQLHSLGDKVAGYLGGSAKYEDGTWTDPTFTLKTVKADGTTDEQSYTSVSAAFEGVGTSFTNIKNEITKQINNLQSEDSAVVHYDKKEKDEIDYTNVTLGKGKDSTPVALHNVANGKIAKDSRDAITGDQMNKIGEDIAKFLGGESSFKDGSLTPPSYALSEVSTEGKVTDKSFNDVGSAFVGLNTNIKHVNDRIKEVSEGVAQDTLSWSKEKGAFVAVHGEDGAKSNSKITSLLDGTVS
ncbi:hypothetical protein, partial [Bartonella sp. ML71XJBT]|uniref:hypothetical protein n=1 Tax=Bartonella sp. ML71XJBT TaxID=3019094 RepID=UPI002360423B